MKNAGFLVNSKSGHERFSCKFNLDLMRIRSYLLYIAPERGKPIALYQSSGTNSFCRITIDLMRIRSYFLYIEPGGWAPIAVYQNPGTNSFVVN